LLPVGPTISLHIRKMLEGFVRGVSSMGCNRKFLTEII
jgi:hypothetical protein